MFETLYPIFFLLIVALVLALALIFLSRYVGKRTRMGKKAEPYECGMDPVGTTRDPVPVKYYMVAILFILFDMEVVFLYPWAIISNRLGLFGLIEMVVFVGILLVGYFYILGRGALKWE